MSGALDGPLRGQHFKSKAGMRVYTPGAKSFQLPNHFVSFCGSLFVQFKQILVSEWAIVHLNSTSSGNWREQQTASHESCILKKPLVCFAVCTNGLHHSITLLTVPTTWHLFSGHKMHRKHSNVTFNERSKSNFLQVSGEIVQDATRSQWIVKLLLLSVLTYYDAQNKH